jgi:Fur family peroxide stress response transcriptional regulator
MADTKTRFDAIVDKLKSAGHKITSQRLAIVAILAESEGHPSVETVYEKIKGEFPNMSLATVYRNVLLMKSLGQVLELGFPDGSNRYDGKKPYPHPHLICVNCRKIVDPDLESLADLSSNLSTETGFQILSHRLDFFGLCPDCRNG